MRESEKQLASKQATIQSMQEREAGRMTAETAAIKTGELLKVKKEDYVSPDAHKKLLAEMME